MGTMETKKPDCNVNKAVDLLQETINRKEELLPIDYDVIDNIENEKIFNSRDHKKKTSFERDQGRSKNKLLI